MVQAGYWHVQDHYENIYAVVKGRKVFTLLPPSDAYRLYIQTCQVARYHKDAAGALVLQPEEPHNVRATVPARLCTHNPY